MMKNIYILSLLKIGKELWHTIANEIAINSTKFNGASDHSTRQQCHNMKDTKQSWLLKVLRSYPLAIYPSLHTLGLNYSYLKLTCFHWNESRTHNAFFITMLSLHEYFYFLFVFVFIRKEVASPPLS